MAQQQMTQEQAQELQERLSRMSPEELRDYQKQNCIFCHISSGKQQAKKIYEDINCLGVLDINPANAGHVLLLPKEHYAVLPLVPDEILGHLAMVAKAISNVMLKALEAKGTTIFVANGAAAGQKAQHVMLHIIPRDEKDGLNIAIPKYRINDAQLKQIKEKLAPKIKELLNYAEKKEEQKPEQTSEEKPIVTIPAMLDVRKNPDEKLLANRRTEPDEIGFSERKEIENKPRVIDVDESEETPEDDSQEASAEEQEESSDEDREHPEEEQETEEETEKVTEAKPRKRKPKKKADDEESESSQEENKENDSSEKPKSGVDLDVIAKLFG
ncbi:HIT family protein [Candidatus Woesearchaeota archaeon]|nr:HIT family protein [Candidatus Woesearchaeota archaeon]